MKRLYLAAAMIAAFNLANAQYATVTAKKVSGYHAYSEGTQTNVYRFVGEYGGNYFAFNGDKPTIQRRCKVVNGKCKGEPTARAALRASVNEGFCQRPDYTTLTCYSGAGGSDGKLAGDGSGAPDSRSHDGSRSGAGAGGGQGSGSGGTNSNGGGKSGSGGGSGNTSGSGGGSSATGSGSGSGAGMGSGGGSGSSSAGNSSGSSSSPPDPEAKVKYWVAGPLNDTKYGATAADACSGTPPGGYGKLELRGDSCIYSYGEGQFKSAYTVTLYPVHEKVKDFDKKVCSAGSDQRLTNSGGGTFSVICTKKAEPTNESGSSVGSLGGDGGKDGKTDGGKSSNGGGGGSGRTGGSKGQSSGSLGGDAGGDSAGGGGSDSASSDGADGGKGSQGGSGSSESSDGQTGKDAKSDGDGKGEGEKGEGKDYTSILENIYDKMSEAVEAISAGVDKILAKLGGGNGDAKSDVGASSGADATGTGEQKGKDAGTDGKGSGKAKGKDGKGDGKGEGEKGEGGKTEGEKEKESDEDGKEGDPKLPDNDFGDAPTVDLGKALGGGSWFGSSAGAVCPAPQTVDIDIFGTFEIDYEWLCRFARFVKPFLIAFAYLTAIFIIVKNGD